MTNRLLRRALNSSQSMEPFKFSDRKCKKEGLQFANNLRVTSWILPKICYNTTKKRRRKKTSLQWYGDRYPLAAWQIPRSLAQRLAKLSQELLRICPVAKSKSRSETVVEKSGLFFLKSHLKKTRQKPNNQTIWSQNIKKPRPHQQDELLSA